jgi:hypothetical protein
VWNTHSEPAFLDGEERRNTRAQQSMVEPSEKRAPCTHGVVPRLRARVCRIGRQEEGGGNGLAQRFQLVVFGNSLLTIKKTGR